MEVLREQTKLGLGEEKLGAGQRRLVGSLIVVLRVVMAARFIILAIIGVERVGADRVCVLRFLAVEIEEQQQLARACIQTLLDRRGHVRGQWSNEGRGAEEFGGRVGRAVGLVALEENGGQLGLCRKTHQKTSKVMR